MSFASSRSVSAVISLGGEVGGGKSTLELKKKLLKIFGKIMSWRTVSESCLLNKFHRRMKKAKRNLLSCNY